MGYGQLERTIIDSARKWPPDFNMMNNALREGADINAVDDDDDHQETLLFCVYEDYIWAYPAKNKDNLYTPMVAREQGFDGRYLPEITSWFLKNGYDVNLNHHGHGGIALMGLLYSSGDRYMVECAKILLDAGADPGYVRKDESTDNVARSVERIAGNFVNFPDLVMDFSEEPYMLEFENLCKEYLAKKTLS